MPFSTKYFQTGNPAINMQQQAIFESLFKRNFSDPGNKEMLEEITAAHPYFSPAQFYLLQQSTEGTGAYDALAGKTNILFNNPHWLNFQLKQANVVDIFQPNPVTEIAVSPQTGLIEETAGIQDEIPVFENSIQPEIKAEPEQIKEDIPAAKQFTELELKEEPAPEPLKIELKLPDEKDIKADDLLFEPMHLVDYFASQGIKLSEEVQTGDKLGKQLKSFTEWLKTMKKVHTTHKADDTTQTDKTVEVMAELSNRENDVITEAMAEVFARQGKAVKAIEVYQKLSLLNPAKSAYFAAKIDNLKEA